MLGVALKGLARRKVRASLTAISIVLGVSMISGTYILTDTINAGFHTIFTGSYQNADVVITGKAAFDSANGTSVEPPTMPQSLLTEVQKLPDVALAAGSVTTSSLKLIGKDGKVISTGGAPALGFSVTPRGPQFKPLLSDTQVVRSGTEQAKKDEQQAGGFIQIIRYALLAFAGIALFVGAFVIANTLSITIAQRMREFATLRTLGASRRQVMWSVVIEAFVIGVLGSVAGLFLGLGIAKLLNALFVAIGIDLPHGSTVFSTRTVVVSLLVGTIVP